MTRLTIREREVCNWIELGLNNKEIARKLEISFRTVEDHRRVIYQKYQVRNAVELVRKVLGADKSVAFSEQSESVN